MTTSAEQKIIDEHTAVPFAWVLKSLGVVLLAAPVIWWAASLQASMSLVVKQVEPIPQMAQDIARLKDKNGLAFQAVDPKSDVSIIVKQAQTAPVVSPSEEVLKPANPEAESIDPMFEIAVIPKVKLDALEKCRDLFGKGNAANSCVKLVMK